MNTNRIQDMIKQYSEELLKMNREKKFADPVEKAVVSSIMPQEVNKEAEEISEPFTDDETAYESTEEIVSRGADITDIPEIEKNDFYNDAPSEDATDEGSTDFASFSARVFTGNNAYAVNNAKVLIIKDGRLYTFLTTDKDGKTKTVNLPSSPKANSFDAKSENQHIDYTGEVYATGFSPKKNLLISAVGGSDIILDVQLTPLSEGVK